MSGQACEDGVDKGSVTVQRHSRTIEKTAVGKKWAFVRTAQVTEKYGYGVWSIVEEKMMRKEWDGDKYNAVSYILMRVIHVLYTTKK